MSVFKTSKKILGMNARNLRIIRSHNSTAAVKLARNKLATKERLLKYNLPTAKLFGVIHNRQELHDFDWSVLPNSFVLKPNFGLGGGGILIIYGKSKTGGWVSGADNVYDEDALKLRVNNILDGDYSISNIPDIAYFEERLQITEEFRRISYKGVPDVRVIVFNSVPVMAMLRLPTKQSGGKANLHIGGVGVGIDLDTGLTNYGIGAHGPITTHPDYGTNLRNIRIPYWDEILRISVEAQRAVGLGYAGVDIVVDKNLGPVVLEVNGHPGLGIQNANRQPLRERLERVIGLDITSTNRGLKVSRDLFSNLPESDDDLPILGVYEVVEVKDRHDKTQVLRTRIDTGLMSTTITRDMASRLGFTEALKAIEGVVLPSVVTAKDAQQAEASFRQTIKGLHPDLIDIVAVRTAGKYVIRPKIPLTFRIGGVTIQAHVAIALDNKLSHPMIIGRRDLHGFLINPAKTK